MSERPVFIVPRGAEPIPNRFSRKYAEITDSSPSIKYAQGRQLPPYFPECSGMRHILPAIAFLAERGECTLVVVNWWKSLHYYSTLLWLMPRIKHVHIWTKGECFTKGHEKITVHRTDILPTREDLCAEGELLLIVESSGEQTRELQLSAIASLQPDAALLYLPIDYPSRTPKNSVIQYLGGRVFVEPFSHTNNSGIRLIWQGEPDRNYSIAQVDGAAHFLNSAIRTWPAWSYADLTSANLSAALVNSFDFCYSLNILYKLGREENLIELWEKVRSEIHNSIYRVRRSSSWDEEARRLSLSALI